MKVPTTRESRVTVRLHLMRVLGAGIALFLVVSAALHFPALQLYDSRSAFQRDTQAAWFRPPRFYSTTQPSISLPSLSLPTSSSSSSSSSKLPLLDNSPTNNPTSSDDSSSSSSSSSSQSLASLSSSPSLWHPPRLSHVVSSDEIADSERVVTKMRDWELSHHITDHRAPPCKEHDSDSEYARKYEHVRAAVIIPSYHDTQYHLVRTVASLVTHTPSYMLAQIIIVDDANEIPMRIDLDERVIPSPTDPATSPPPTTRFNNNSLQLLPPQKFYPFLSILRLPTHSGLSVAKNEGARLAIRDFNATHLVFLEAHCDAQPGWLQPLIDLLQAEPRTLAVPVVDMLDWSGADMNTLSYNPVHAYMGGTFGWDLIFQWVMPKNPSSNPVNFDTAMLSGGLYAVAVPMYESIKMLDDGLTGWGGENVELAIKSWTCATGIKIVPCGRVGHLFRKSFPYSVDRRPLVANMARVFLVWIGDEFLDVFLKHYQDMKNQIRHVAKIFALQKQGRINDAERLFQRTSRSDLHFTKTVLTGLLERYQLARTCKPFQWYMENVLPTLKSEADSKREEERKAQAERDRNKPTRKVVGQEHVNDADRAVAKHMGFPHLRPSLPSPSPSSISSSFPPPATCLRSKVLCLFVVRSNPDGVEQMRAVFDTWARDCAGILMFGKGVVPDGAHELPFVVSPLLSKDDSWINLLLRIKFAIETTTQCFFQPDTYASLPGDIQRICTQVWLRPDLRHDLMLRNKNEINEVYQPRFDWLFKVDDDTFVIQQNLCDYLHSLSNVSAVRPMWLGRRFRYPSLLPSAAPMPAVYYTSGSGYLLNSPAARRLTASLLDTRSQCSALLQSFGANYPEDLSMGACLELSGVDAYDTRDRISHQQRFHPFMPGLTTQVIAADTWLAQYDRDPVLPRDVPPIQVIAASSILFHSVKNPTYMRELHALFSGEAPDETSAAARQLVSVAPTKHADTCRPLANVYQQLIDEKLADPFIANRLLPQFFASPASASKSIVQQINEYIETVQHPPSCSRTRAVVYNFDRNFQPVGAALSDVIEAFSASMTLRRTFVFSTHVYDGYHYPFLPSNCTDDPALPSDASTFECMFLARRLSPCTESELHLSKLERDQATAGSGPTTVMEQEPRVLFWNVPDRQWRSLAADSFKTGLCDKAHAWPNAKLVADALYSSSSSLSSSNGNMNVPALSAPSSMEIARWRSQIISGWLSPRHDTLKEVEGAMVRMGWPSSIGECEAVVGVHVVRGERLGQDSNHLPLDRYMDEVVKIADRYKPIKYVYLSTEDASPREEWDKLPAALTSRFTLLFDPSELRANGIAVNGLPGRVEFAHTFEQSEEAMISVRQMLLLANCDFLVGAFSSFFFKAAWLAKAASRNFHVVSLEDNRMYSETCLNGRFEAGSVS